MDDMRRIYVAGHAGMVGSSICQTLRNHGRVELITRTRDQLNLLDQEAVCQFFKNERISEVILAAAKVGGIHANESFPAEFIDQNLQIQNNIIHSAHLNVVQKLLFLGSSCIYPKHAEQPMSEAALLTGSLEPTNKPYAIAKIAGITMCESYNRQYGRDYRSVMPTNLYGPGDNFSEMNSHVVPALMRRVHHAKVNNLSKVVIWGSGKPRREFLYVADMAEASLFVHDLDLTVCKKFTEPMLPHVNIGTGTDVTIRELATLMQEVVGYSGSFEFDSGYRDGTMQKLLDVSKLQKLGWSARTDLRTGLLKTYTWLQNNEDKLRI